MRKLWKATLAALSITACMGVAGCAGAQSYGYGGYDDYGYGQPPGGISYNYASGGYCDTWGCPDDYYDLPVYYGSVYFGGDWFNGPLYYRDWGGARQYWVRGGWHYDDWRGARPNWYTPGRYGPALGRDFYRSDRFRNAPAFTHRDRGGFNRGDFGRPNFNGNDGNRNTFNGNGNGNGNGNRGPRNDGNGFGNRNAAPQGQAAPQPQPQQDRGQRFGNGPRQDFQRSGPPDRVNVQRNDAPRDNGGGGNRDRGGDRGDRGNR